MNGTSSICFFSFGPNDSFISKSHEGLRHHDLPPTLDTLITSGSVQDVYWASLGPISDSWVISFKNSSGKQALAWGGSTPSRLAKVLSKISPSHHLRFFLGPSSSYIAWDSTFIRWSDLPDSLEDSLQSWLTPSGWRTGPPRMISWGVDDAFFAMSEYGDVKYRLGDKTLDEWPTWRETVQEWRDENGFRWSEVAYIALDPSTPDQFVAIRNDGTWSGAIDANSDALTTFAHNYFRLTTSHPDPKSKPPPKEQSRSQSQSNGTSHPRVEPPDPETQAIYKQWSMSTNVLFASALAGTAPPKRGPKKLQIRSQSSPASMPSPTASTVPPNALLNSFPYIPAAVLLCAIPICVLQKSDPVGLRACKHDVERLFRASGQYSYEWLRQERLRWHPDRFGRLCEESWKEEGKRLAEEMFKIVDGLIDELKKENDQSA